MIKRMPRVLSIGLLGGLLLCSACVEEIDLNVPSDLRSALVIQGELVKGNPSQVTVTVSNLFTFSSNSRQRVNVQELLLLDEEGNSWDVQQRGLGRYTDAIPQDIFSVETGKRYYIRLRTFDGRVLESIPSLLAPVPAIERIDVELRPGEARDAENQIIELPVLDYKLNTNVVTADGQAARLRLFTDRVYQLTDDPGTDYTFAVIPFQDLPATATGLAITDPDGIVVQFLSWGETFVAQDGLAEGARSRLLAVSQEDADPGTSLQLVGEGNKVDQFVWAPPRPQNRGRVNIMQTLRPCAKVSTSKTCYISEPGDVTNVKLVNGPLLQQDRIENFTVLVDPADQYYYAEGFYLNVYQESLNEGAFTYWQQVSELIDRTGSLFEIPAGQLISNLRNVGDEKEEVIGYFYATQRDTIRVYVSPDQAGNPGTYCPPSGPPSPGSECPDELCCDCLSADNSQQKRPIWWEE